MWLQLNAMLTRLKMFLEMLKDDLFHMDTEVAHSRDCCNSNPFYSGRQQYGLRVMAPTA